jgi:hypothetical protein
MGIYRPSGNLGTATAILISRTTMNLDRARSANHHIDDFNLDEIVFHKPGGTTLSLRRFLGRWIIMRVIESLDAGLLPERRDGLDSVAMNVVVNPEALDGTPATLPDTVLDDAHAFRKSFPGLSWPSTFVIDPSGQLVAILSDESYEPFMHCLVGSGRSTQLSGAIDLGDINH